MTKSHKSRPRAILSLMQFGFALIIFKIKGGFQVLAATVKIGSKNFVHMEVLQSIKSKMDHLPEKQKTMLDFRDAALFLYPCIKAALQKNYTKDEILQIIIKEGWSLTQNSFRYLWSFFLSEDEHYGKKKYSPKSASKEKRTTSKANVRHSSENPDVDLLQSDEILNEQKNDADISITESSTLDNEKNEIQGSTNEKLLPENSQENSNQTQSAHFDIPPDTEDL